MTEKNKQLQKRVEDHAIAGIKFTNQLPQTTANKLIISQFIRAITSIGANYQEACEAESSKDFVHKIRISKKEARETIYWLRLLYRTNDPFQEAITRLGTETEELVKIFSSIVSKFSQPKVK